LSPPDANILSLLEETAAREQTHALCPFSYDSFIPFFRQNIFILPFLVPTAI
jgi:hypothetical protein